MRVGRCAKAGPRPVTVNDTLVLLGILLKGKQGSGHEGATGEKVDRRGK